MKKVCDRRPEIPVFNQRFDVTVVLETSRLIKKDSTE